MMDPVIQTATWASSDGNFRVGFTVTYIDIGFFRAPDAETHEEAEAFAVNKS